MSDTKVYLLDGGLWSSTAITPSGTAGPAVKSAFPATPC